MDVNKVINNLKKWDQVHLDDGVNPYVGFVKNVDDESIIINIFVADIDVEFKREDIKEISIINKG